MQLFDLTHHAKAAALHYVDVQMDKTVSTHASREGRDIFSTRYMMTVLVSTHTSREGRDGRRLLASHAQGVSTHASREGRGRPTALKSRRPLCFNSRVPQRARRYAGVLLHAELVSTHASREGRDGISRIHRYDNTQRPRLRDGSRRRWFTGLMRRGSVGIYRRCAVRGHLGIFM